LNALLNLLLYWCGGYMRCRLIHVDGAPYLERYFVGTLFGRHVYLHRFLESDNPDQGVHDHPWKWSVSFIVCGMYVEHRRWGKGTLKRWFNFIGGDHFHLVALVPSVYTWSLFIAGPTKPGRVWGMLRKLDELEYALTTRGDVNYAFVPYDYGAPGKNPLPGAWWETEMYGREQAREPVSYVKTGEKR
jgi:hypothetical protein